MLNWSPPGHTFAFFLLKIIKLPDMLLRMTPRVWQDWECSWCWKENSLVFSMYTFQTWSKSPTILNLLYNNDVIFRTISQWNCLPKALVDSGTIVTFKHDLKNLILQTLVALVTLAFILQLEILLIIYSDSDSNIWLYFIFSKPHVVSE